MLHVQSVTCSVRFTFFFFLIHLFLTASTALPVDPCGHSPGWCKALPTALPSSLLHTQLLERLFYNTNLPPLPANKPGEGLGEEATHDAGLLAKMRKPIRLSPLTTANTLDSEGGSVR